MFTSTVTIPFIDSEALLRLQEVVPGLALLVDVPLTHSTERAVEAATLIMRKRLDRYEYISRVEETTFDSEAKTWSVKFVMGGD